MEENMEKNENIKKELAEIRESVAGLQDMFVRRLMEDRQKAAMIRSLRELSEFAVIEPFLRDLLLILDRTEGTDDEMIQSVHEELYDVLSHRGLARIQVGEKFDPAVQSAIRTVSTEGIGEKQVAEVVRSGYTFNGKVLRAAEVIVAAPAK